MPLCYASVECKVVAFPESSFDGEDKDVDPVFKVNTAAVVMEILDDDGVPIKTSGKRGNVIVANLLKPLQPTIRYPIGDVAEWYDYHAGVFRLRGRSNVGLKIGTALLDRALMRNLVTEVMGKGIVDSFQTIIRRQDQRNIVIFRVAAKRPANADDLKDKLEAAVVKNKPAWARNRDEGFIAPIEIEWVDFDDLVFLEASGKLKEVVDERF